MGRGAHIAHLLVLLSLAVVARGSSAQAAQDSPAARVACAFAGLDLRGKVGQIFMVAIDGTRLTRHTTALLRSWRAGGVVLFERNIGSAGDLRSLTTALQSASALPLLIATDQEGGSVVRVRVGLTPLPSAAYYGSIGSAARVYGDTRAQGEALRSLGINLDLAPVVDVRSLPGSAIGSRSFGSDPALVSRLVDASVRGYQAAGIGATAKHFLGLGSVAANADLRLPVVGASRQVLEARDLAPMRAAIGADVDALMVTRVAIPALDPTGTAAYASASIIRNVVRGELRYTGAIITDSLLSTAVLGGPGVQGAALAALGAGDDILLLGSGASPYEPLIAGAVAAIGEAVALHRIPLARLDDAVLHVLRLKARLGLLPRCSTDLHP